MEKNIFIVINCNCYDVYWGLCNFILYESRSIPTREKLVYLLTGI